MAVEARQRLRPEVVSDGEGTQERHRQHRRHQGRGGDYDGEQGRHLHHLGVAKVCSKIHVCIVQGKVAILWLVFSGGATLRRQRIIVATSSIVHASYHPSESQIITLSIDGSLAYWEVVDGEEIRGVTVRRICGCAGYTALAIFRF